MSEGWMGEDARRSIALDRPVFVGVVAASRKAEIKKSLDVWSDTSSDSAGQL